ncbi:molecular chaperone DjiA [Salipiger marinus]|uniref:DnaJ like chaperone protein n=1 Tax=Salipiger marinus TaxID=555512 RepID=A0A1G8ULU6_9RHOB|nr:molecular chaperone DjiA [Salipiger marinus]SDJ54125.1 DnaJ like chaperone protein [Salipiger marinus]
MNSDIPRDHQSLWQRILGLISAGVSAVRSVLEQREGMDSVTFSIAFIALSAKLAKADGTVTRDEVAMFRRIFEIPPHEEKNAARVYDLCRQDTTGFEFYARKMAGSLAHSENAQETLETVLDGLFHIAMADGDFHPGEEAFLKAVADIFRLSPEVFLRLRAQHVPGFHYPWTTLGLDRTSDLETLSRTRREFLKTNHPDMLIARGLPPEMVALADARLAAFNSAYEEALRQLAPAMRKGGRA